MRLSEPGTCDLCNTTVQLNNDGANYPIEVTVKAKGETEVAEIHVQGKKFEACEFNEQLLILEINFE